MRKWLVHPIKRRIAKYYLVFLRKFFGLKVIAITGSAGKTSTKEMLASILKLKGKTIASYANIDPVYNIPTTILKCSPKTKYLVLEMGVEYPGEMDFYLWLAKPDIALILNIYPTHTEFFKDEEGVFNEKRKLADALEKEAIVILNHDDKRLLSLKDKLKAKVIWYSNKDHIVKSSNEFTLQSGKSKLDVQIPILGKQFIQNAVAAGVCAEQLGVAQAQIKQGLESFSPPEHRMRLIRHKTGALILDDTYNSNPQAAKEALKTFEEFAKNKNKIVVMGDMLELGALEEKYHKELGEVIGGMNIDYLIGVGLISKLMVEVAAKKLGQNKTAWVLDQSKVFSLVSPLLKKNTAVLIKGSRSIHLEKVVERLSKR